MTENKNFDILFKDAAAEREYHRRFIYVRWMEKEKCMEAFISDIQLFSVGDGPGIRTTVFFKGCNLKCRWCHNPEAISFHKELLYYANRCVRCGACVAACPQGCHTISEEGHLLNRENCILCGKCTEVCFPDALSIVGKTMTIEEVYNKVKQDKNFYENSGGGVTLSGGEPMMQPDFVYEFSKLCFENGIDVLIETAANYPFERLERVLPYVKDFYVDLKGATDEDYKENTQGNMTIVKENMTKLVKAGANVTARLPIIPEYNDTLEYCAKMAAILKETGISAVHLLPFHKLCDNKYTAMGDVYTCRDLETPTKEHMKELLKAFNGFQASVQG